MQATNRSNVSTQQLCAAALVAALIATAATVSAEELAAAKPTTKPSIQVQWVGVFTGEYVNGVPVYRLPTVTVSASRKVESAKMAQEDKLARSKTAQLKVSTQPSASATDKPAIALNARYK